MTTEVLCFARGDAAIFFEVAVEAL